MKFIYLTDARTAKEITIVLDKIVAVLPPGVVHTIGTQARVFAGDSSFEVLETPRQVLQIIHKAQSTDC